MFPDLVPSMEAYVLLLFALLGILPVYMSVVLLEYRKSHETCPLWLIVTPIAARVQSHIHVHGFLTSLSRIPIGFPSNSDAPQWLGS